MVTLEQGKKLIKLARNTIDSAFTRKDIKVNSKIQKEFSEKMGVFVTLNIGKQLRGCVGFPDAVYPLHEGISKAAMSAAFNDSRFAPLTKKEFNNVKIEVSILSVPRMIEVSNPEDYIKNIEIGKEGLIVKGTFESGLLLPQVAKEQGWNQEIFLSQTCVKAGLPADSWHDFNICRVYKFRSDVFSETETKGNVIKVI